MRVGKLVCIEGIDASGKSKVAEQLCQELNYKGCQAVVLNKKDLDFSTEYITKFMANIKKSMWESKKDDPVQQISERAWLYLHAFWYEVVENDRLNLMMKSYDYVIIDGWFYKFLARHFVNVGKKEKYPISIFEKYKKGDFIYLLDIEPSICWGRRKEFKLSEMGAHAGMQQESCFESYVGYQNLVRKEYLNMAQENKWNIIHVDG